MKKRLFYIFIWTALTASAVFLISCEEKPLAYSLDRCAVLSYHAVSDEPPEVNSYLFVSGADFDSQMKLICASKLNTVFARDVPTAKQAVAITFDDGYDSVYTEAFPVLKKYGLKATVFLITDTVGTRGHLSLSQMNEMEESGLFSFESHSASHADLTLLDESSLESELSGSYLYIKSRTGASPSCIAYPYGKYSESVERKILECSYFYAFTTEYPENRQYPTTQIPRVSVFRGDGTSPVEKALAKVNG